MKTRYTALFAVALLALIGLQVGCTHGLNADKLSQFETAVAVVEGAVPTLLQQHVTSQAQADEILLRAHEALDAVKAYKEIADKPNEDRLRATVNLLLDLYEQYAHQKIKPV